MYLYSSSKGKRALPSHYLLPIDSRWYAAIAFPLPIGASLENGQHFTHNTDEEGKKNLFSPCNTLSLPYSAVRIDT